VKTIRGDNSEVADLDQRMAAHREAATSASTPPRAFRSLVSRAVVPPLRFVGAHALASTITVTLLFIVRLGKIDLDELF
jgi:hypothetical protein